VKKTPKPVAKSVKKAADRKASAPARAPKAEAKAGGTGMANVRPLRDRVLVKRIEETEQKVGGIIIPDSAKEKPQQAEVVAVGSGRLLENGTRVPLAVKAGDKVLVGKWSGTDVRIDGNDYLILKEDEILGILG
jgi:chaperonin GroES